jgi:SAM-dependent methyltransferase
MLSFPAGVAGDRTGTGRTPSPRFAALLLLALLAVPGCQGCAVTTKGDPGRPGGDGVQRPEEAASRTGEGTPDPGDGSPLPSPGDTAATAVEARLGSLRTGEYVYGPASRDGIGKYHLGREISHVMGHRGAAWLERPDRRTEERTDLLLDFLMEQPGRVVADIGAGTGYFAIPWARRLGEGGEVLGVDIQPEMLQLLQAMAAEAGVGNVVPVQGRIDDPRLPADSVDVVLMVDAYHEFSHPREMQEGLFRALKAGGRVVLVEYRGEDPSVPIKELHKMTEEQAVREWTRAGFEHVVTEDFLPQQHVLVFRKPVG